MEVEDEDEFGDLYASVGASTCTRDYHQQLHSTLDEEKEEEEDWVLYGKAESQAATSEDKMDVTHCKAGDGHGNGEESDTHDIDHELQILVSDEEEEEEEEDLVIVTGEGEGDGGVMKDLQLERPSTDQQPLAYSQFKHVRSGTVAVSGAGPSGGVVDENLSKFKLSVFNGAGNASVIGRGDWSTNGGRGNQHRSFHSEVAMPMPRWGCSAMSHRRTGFDFTLPRSKTIFDINVDKFEEKRWRQPGVDVSDFFNFDLNEDSWKHYCKQLQHLRLEATMQRKICVYESGQSEEKYGPDLPPELLAVSGPFEVSGESVQHRSDIGSFDVLNLGKGSASRRQLPIGRAIEVEGGIHERLPSGNVRRPLLSDSDSVIQIVLHDAMGDDSASPTCAPENADHTSQNEDSGKVDNKVQREKGRVNAGYLLQELKPTYNLESEIPIGKSFSERGTSHRYIRDGDGMPLPARSQVTHQQISNVEPDIYPVGSLGLPLPIRQSVPYKSYSYFEDEHSNGSIVNQGVTVADSHHEKKNAIRKRLPVAGCVRDIEKNPKDEMHFDKLLETHGRQSSEQRIPPDEDNIKDNDQKRQNLIFQKELLESIAADHKHILNISRSHNSKAKSANGRDFCEDQGDVEQVGSICRQKKWSYSSSERKELPFEEKTHFRLRNECFCNGSFDSEDILSLKVRDIPDYHRGEEDPYLNKYQEGTCYNEAQEESVHNHREKVIHTKFWEQSTENLQILIEQFEDGSRRNRLEKVRKLKHRLSGQVSKRHEIEEHLHGRERKDAHARNNHYNRHVNPGWMDGQILKQQGIDKHSYPRKDKEGNIYQTNQVDNDEGIRNQREKNDICRFKLDRDDRHLSKEEETSRRDAYDDSNKIEQIEDAWRWRERENKHRREKEYEVCYKIDREERCWLSERSRHRDYKLWHRYYRGKNHAKEEARLFGIQRDKLYEKRICQEHCKGRACIDEDGRSKYHEWDDICSGKDCLAYQQRNSRHNHSQVRYEIAGSGCYGGEPKFYREKHKLDIMSEELHSNDWNGSTSGLADDKIRHDLTIMRESRKHEDCLAVHQGEKVSIGGMDIQETEKMWDSLPNHQTQNQENVAETFNRMHEQTGVCLDVVKLDRCVLSGWLSENHHIRRRSKVDSREHYKEKVSDLDSTHGKEARSVKEDTIKTEKAVNKVHTSLKEIEAGKDKQHLIKGHGAAMEREKAVMEETAHASEGKVLKIDQVNRQHLEMLRKLEKRRERFKQPIIVEKPMNKKPQYETTIQKEMAEVKKCRPARKRRWGSG